jgi:hypothetical protein
MTRRAEKYQKTTENPKISPELKKELNKDDDWGRYKNFKVLFANQDFQRFFRARNFFKDELFESVFRPFFRFNTVINIQKFVYKRIELKIFKYLGLRNDMAYLQLVSYLAEYGLNVQSFLRLCFDGVLNKDNDFLIALLGLIRKRMGENEQSNFKEIEEKLLEEIDDNKTKFDAFRYGFDFFR